MPADNGSGCHLDERFLPSSPAPSQYDPEQLVRRRESPARALGVKSEQLLTQGKIFEDDILAGPECTNNPAQEVPEPYDHAQNLTGTLPIELGAKLLILRVYDVLMNDRGDRGMVSSIKSRIRVGMCIMQNEKYVNPFEDVHKKAKAFKDHARETNKKDEDLREKQAVRDAEPQRSPKTGQ